ncbi:hypothetical protein GCM10011391_18870 [Pullulanibacillus camelliae]|uniref:Uncharacterized protein n=1 Tax=Pullulanibacillus camelliae TaxID=1707096 RepID=A0A8J2YDK6_9BACL|nr:hypothetical protein GCM10011391_18870 [Pullulanibacillus camelliae]
MPAESERQKRKSPVNAIPNFNIYFGIKGEVCPKTGSFVLCDYYKCFVAVNLSILFSKKAWPWL